MNNLELQKLESALEKCRDLEAGLAADKNHLATGAAERIALENSLDLADGPGLTRLAQLQVMANLAPQRAAAQQSRLEAARQELVAAAHEFIRVQLRPRFLKLRELAESRVRESLKPHYHDEHELAVVANGSETMVALERIGAHTLIGGTRTEGCQEKARKILQAWSDADQFEKAHLN
jgi:hypothetical protein